MYRLEHSWQGLQMITAEGRSTQTAVNVESLNGGLYESIEPSEIDRFVTAEMADCEAHLAALRALKTRNDSRTTWKLCRDGLKHEWYQMTYPCDGSQPIYECRECGLTYQDKEYGR